MSVKLPAQLPAGIAEKMRTLAEECDDAGVPMIILAATRDVESSKESARTLHVSQASVALSAHVSGDADPHNILELMIALAAASQETTGRLMLAYAILADVEIVAEKFLATHAPDDKTVH